MRMEEGGREGEVGREGGGVGERNGRGKQTTHGMGEGIQLQRKSVRGRQAPETEGL